MHELEQKIIDEEYEKIDECMGVTIYKKGHHRIITMLDREEPLEYIFDRTEASWQKYLRSIYKK